MRERLCNTFRKVTSEVWNLLADSQYYGLYKTSPNNVTAGLGFGEETITDTLLLSIYRKNPLDFYTIKIGKNYESQEGADWEWWIMSASGIIGLRLQAKRIHYINNVYSYPHLGYRISNSNNLQVDTLITRANQMGVAPLYILYNHWDINFPYKSYLNNESQRLEFSKIHTKKNLSLTIASAPKIKSLVVKNPPQNRLTDVLPISWPIYSLVCCSFSDISESVKAFLEKYIFKESDVKIKVYETLPNDIFSRFEGEDNRFTPLYTTFILDHENPHKDIAQVIKEMSIRRYIKKVDTT